LTHSWAITGGGGSGVTRTCWAFVIVLGVLLQPLAARAESDTSGDPQSLRTAQAVQLEVPEFTCGELTARFPASELRERLALRMREAGIPVIAAGDSARGAHGVRVVMRLGCLEVYSDRVLQELAIDMSVRTWQRLRRGGLLRRGPAYDVPTWTIERLVQATPGDGFREDVLENVDEEIESFVYAWTLAHPEHRGTRR
jgi:hypothetical protein